MIRSRIWEYLEGRGHSLIKDSRERNNPYEKYWICEHCDTQFQIMRIKWRETLCMLNNPGRGYSKYWAEPEPVKDLPLCSEIIVKEVIK